MGAWGTGIYSNDTAEDVRDFCGMIFPFTSVSEGNRIVFEEFAEIANAEVIDDDAASFWYALSDWQWRHGILSEEIKKKTLQLLDERAGISDWEEMGSTSDVKRRIAVMEQLKERLNSPMPFVNLPKKRLARAKHKIGQIVIFRARKDDESEFWKIEDLNDPFIYQDERLAQTATELSSKWNVQGKYMAVCCVGSEKTPYSKYLPELYEESSVYAFYDFISDNPPDIETLRLCGFLPMRYFEWKDFNRNIIDYVGWTYWFTLGAESFRVSKHSDIDEIFTIKDEGEALRFRRGLEQKNYLDVVDGYFELEGAFRACLGEKKLLEAAGMLPDTLLDDNMENPRLKAPEEINKRLRDFEKTVESRFSTRE